MQAQTYNPRPPLSSVSYPVRPTSNGYGYKINTSSDERKEISLKAAYKQLFKENRELDFHRNKSLESEYLNGRLTMRQLVAELICSDMYVNYILAVNSNYRFVDLCFEWVLGRKATQSEIFQWSSLLASEGLRSFAQKLTECDDYSEAFGDHVVPSRRSMQISSSSQGLPALPKELSAKRYTGNGNVEQFQYYGPSTLPWEGSLPPKALRKLGAVLVVAGTIEVVRVIAAIAWTAYTNGGL